MDQLKSSVFVSGLVRPGHPFPDPQRSVLERLVEVDRGGSREEPGDGLNKKNLTRTHVQVGNSSSACGDGGKTIHNPARGCCSKQLQA